MNQISINISQPWSETRPLEPREHSTWTHRTNLQMLASIVDELFQKCDADDNRSIIVVELGTWLGATTNFLCSLAKPVKVISVDLWDSEDIKAGNQVIPFAQIEKLVQQNDLFDIFQSNVWQYREQIVPLKMTTVQGLAAIALENVMPDVIYIDANHTYNDVRNEIDCSIALFGLSPVLCGDDYKWLGVRQAVDEAAQRYNMSVETIENHTWRLVPNQQ